MLDVIRTALQIVELLVAGVAALIVLGYKFGKKEEGMRNIRAADQTGPVVDGGKGIPSNGELSRRLDALEGELGHYMRKGEADAHYAANRTEHQDLWGAVNNMRTIDNLITRRIDALMGQNS